MFLTHRRMAWFHFFPSAIEPCSPKGNTPNMKKCTGNHKKIFDLPCLPIPFYRSRHSWPNQLRGLIFCLCLHLLYQKKKYIGTPLLRDEKLYFFLLWIMPNPGMFSDRTQSWFCQWFFPSLVFSRKESRWVEGGRAKRSLVKPRNSTRKHTCKQEAILWKQFRVCESIATISTRAVSLMRRQ